MPRYKGIGAKLLQFSMQTLKPDCLCSDPVLSSFNCVTWGKTWTCPLVSLFVKYT